MFSVRFFFHLYRDKRLKCIIGTRKPLQIVLYKCYDYVCKRFLKTEFLRPCFEFDAQSYCQFTIQFLFVLLKRKYTYFPSIVQLYVKLEEMF